MPWMSSRSRRHVAMSDCPSRTPVAPEYSVRDAEATDVDVLVSFTLLEAREAEGYDADEAAVRRGVGAAFIDAPPSRYWIGECDGEPVASVSVVTEWSNFRGGNYWWIQSIFIQPEHRGSGLIEKLIDGVATAARTSGALDLRLYARDSNSRALQAYRRYGFVSAPYVMMKMDLKTGSFADAWRPDDGGR